MSNNWWEYRRATWDALAAGELSQAEFIILGYLWDRADTNHRAYLSHSQISRRTNVDRGWVRECTESLKRKGWLEKKKRKIDRGHSWTFTLTMPSVAKSRAKWAEIQKALKEKMSSNDFNSFFGPLAADIDQASMSLTLKTPDEFTTSWLEDNWLDLVEDTAKDHGITNVAITTATQ